ncbi:MAG: hypothetical protein M0R77_10555 [Gammaproteobacteria bacterium]|nr:hypothetical protein [Gammaproteobacteria bacterium]
MNESPTSLKAILTASGSAWGRQVLYRNLLTVQYTPETQLAILRYVLEHFMFCVSPREDFYQNPTLDDKIVLIMDTWEEAWLTIISEGFYSYIGYNQRLKFAAGFMA